MRNILNTEPAILFALVRAVAYIAAGATGAWLSPDLVETILPLVAGLLGVDAATTAATRANVSSEATTAQQIDAVYSGPIGSFVRKTVVDLVPDSNVKRGLLAAVPIVTDFANQALNDETRDAIQRRVMLTMRSTGLLNTRSTRSTSILVALLAVGVAGCAPLAAGVIEIVGGDGATLRAIPGGLEFDPGAAPALGVVVMLTYEEATGLDDRCVEEPEGDIFLATCRLGEVSTVDLVRVESDALEALARYQRTGSARTYGVALD